VAVTGRFQGQRAALVGQRQAVYARMHRPLELESSSEECICEFLRVRFQVPLFARSQLAAC
jgi:hypothetical protein